VQTLDAPLFGSLDQAPGQPDPQPSTLEPVLHQRRVLGPVGAPLALVAHHGHDLALVIRVQRYQREPVLPIYLGEAPRLFFRELPHGTEETQLYRTLARPAHEPLQRRGILGPDLTYRHARPIPQYQNTAYRHAEPMTLTICALHITIFYRVC
jgi:hypothetical protein